MADSGRKDFSDKMADKVTPQSEKSTLDKAKEGLGNVGDKVGRDAVPDSEKSTGQSLSDKASREKDHQKGGDSVLDQAKNAVGLGK